MIRLLLQKQFDLGLSCLSRPFWQVSSARIFRTFTLMDNFISNTYLHESVQYFVYSRRRNWLIIKEGETTELNLKRNYYAGIHYKHDSCRKYPDSIKMSVPSPTLYD